MSKAKRIIIIVTAFVIMVLAGFVIGILPHLTQNGSSNTPDNSDLQNQEEMLGITLEWGRLAPLPASKDQFLITTEGGAFTRSFRSSFNLAKTDLDAWIIASPGLQDAEILDINDTTKKYIIKPGGGAGYAEAVIDFDKCHVETYVYWS